MVASSVNVRLKQTFFWKTCEKLVSCSLESSVIIQTIAPVFPPYCCAPRIVRGSGRSFLQKR